MILKFTQKYMYSTYHLIIKGKYRLNKFCMVNINIRDLIDHFASIAVLAQVSRARLFSCIYHVMLCEHGIRVKLFQYLFENVVRLKSASIYLKKNKKIKGLFKRKSYSTKRMERHQQSSTSYTYVSMLSILVL